jgi:DNA repair photolyase
MEEGADKRARGDATFPDRPLPDRPRKGRGAVGNPTGRFEPTQRHAIDDGWGGAEDEPSPLRTTVTHDATRSIIARNDSPDIPFDRSINPYRGCEHGCVYCYARPSHAYLGLSPGLDFETRLFAKPNAAALLRRELRRPGYRCAPVALGANTDPYQPIERQYRLTREILKVLAGFAHPVIIVTKSALVTRDIDILAPMAERNLVRVCVSVTTLDRGLARRLEPRAATPPRRLAAIQTLSEAGVPTGVMAAPMIPAVNDMEMERILQAARIAGAGSASYTLLRLPHEIKDLFRDWLAVHLPDRADKVLNLVRESRGGRLNDPQFGSRMTGSGAHAELLRSRFDLACRRLGFEHHDFGLDNSLFRPPLEPDDQLSLSL